MKQTSSDVLLDGKTSTLSSLADFVATSRPRATSPSRSRSRTAKKRRATTPTSFKFTVKAIRDAGAPRSRQRSRRRPAHRRGAWRSSRRSGFAEQRTHNALGLNKLPGMASCHRPGDRRRGMVSYHYLYAGFPRAFSEMAPSARAPARCGPAWPRRDAARPRAAGIQRGLDAERRLVDFREELKNLDRQFNDLKVCPARQARTSPTMLRRIQTLATQSAWCEGVPAAGRRQQAVNQECR